MAKKTHTTKKQTRGIKAAGRARHRSRPRQAVPADLEAKVEEARKLARSDAPLDLIRDYVKIGIALDEELAGRRDANLIKELSTARVSFAVRLGIAPRGPRPAGEFRGSIGEALLRATDGARKVLRAKWTSLTRLSPAELAASPRALFQRVFSRGRPAE